MYIFIYLGVYLSYSLVYHLVGILNIFFQPDFDASDIRATNCVPFLSKKKHRMIKMLYSLVHSPGEFGRITVGGQQMIDNEHNRHSKIPLVHIIMLPRNVSSHIMPCFLLYWSFSIVSTRSRGGSCQRYTLLLLNHLLSLTIYFRTGGWLGTSRDEVFEPSCLQPGRSSV